MDWLTQAIMVGVGVLSVVGSVSKNGYFRPGLSLGKGPPTHTITPIGRACFLILGVAAIYVGLTGNAEFVRFR
jgi:hypothetical protein